MCRKIHLTETTIQHICSELCLTDKKSIFVPIATECLLALCKILKVKIDMNTFNEVINHGTSFSDENGCAYISKATIRSLMIYLIPTGKF